MKIVVLGSGTCVSGLPGIPNRFPPAFLVEWEESDKKEKIIFDCSEGLRFRLEQVGYDFADIDHVAISHAHPDHCALVHYVQSVFCKGLWGGKKNERIDVYCPDQIANEFDRVWDFHVPEMSGILKYDWPVLDFHRMSYKELSLIGSARLFSARVYHGFGRVDALAFRLETPNGIFVYSGDTGLCNGIRRICEKADVFICEASARIGDFQTPDGFGHLNPYLAGQISKEGNVKKLFLFHYTGLDSDEAMVQEVRRSGFSGEILIAKDFQEIIL